MIFQIKAASLPKGSKKQLNCIFVVALQNEQSQAALDANTLQLLPESVQSALNTAIAAEHFTAASGQQIGIIDHASHSQFIVLGVGKKREKQPKPPHKRSPNTVSSTKPSKPTSTLTRI